MKAIQITFILIVIFILTAGSQAMAADFSCGSRTVSVGDHLYDVLNACGKPSYIDSWEKEVMIRDVRPRILTADRTSELFVKELVEVEDWEYNFGPNRFIRYLRFENGRLVRIIDGEYGY